MREAREIDLRLHAAVKSGNCEEASSLIKEGADVNAHNAADETPLYTFCKNDYNFNCKDFGKRMILLLLSNGADIYGHLLEWAKEIIAIEGDAENNAISWVKISEFPSLYVSNCIISVYRQADANGNPIPTYLELKNERFNTYTAPLVAYSIFKNNTGVVDVMIEQKLCHYLSCKDIKNTFALSKIENAEENIVNSDCLKNADTKAQEDADQYFGVKR